MLDARVGRGHQERIALLGLVVLATIVVWPLRSYGLIPNDEGWLFHPALRMAEGEVLYRDVWVHYAPLRFHLIEALFSITGPSLLAARSLLALMIIGSAALLFRISLRFAPVHLAVLPAAVYVLVPGPWYAAFYAFCTLLFFLALARWLEAPTSARLLWLGAVAGLTLVTRHELGLAQLGLATAVTAAEQARRHIGQAGSLRQVWRTAAIVVGSAALPGLVVVAYYGSQGALAGLAEALFVRAFGQLAGNDPAHVRQLLSPGSFGVAIEGRLAGTILLAPIALYAGLAAVLARRCWRDGVGTDVLFGGSLLLYGLATVSQGFTPPLVVRFLQAGAPVYLAATWLAGVAAQRSPLFALAAWLTTATAGAVLVWGVVLGIPRIDPTDSFTGSARMRQGDALVSVLGTDVLADQKTAEQARLARSFVATHTEPGEPVFAAPWLSLHYVLLDRPNPTSYVFERMGRGDLAMSGPMKAAQMKRLLDSRTRYALVLTRWWLQPAAYDLVRRTLHDHFATVRDYGEILILERSTDDSLREFSELHQRARRRRPLPDDLQALERLTARLPDEPLPAMLLGAVLVRTDETTRGEALLARAVGLDPENPAPRELLSRNVLSRDSRDSRDLPSHDVLSRDPQAGSSNGSAATK